MTYEERFRAKYKIDSKGCWVWTAAKWGTSAGKPFRYGAFKYEGKVRGAHIASWLMAGNTLLPGQQVLHKCDNPLCVNPAHLFAGTQRDNMQDALKKGRLKFSTKLTNQQVEAIIADGRTQMEIAAAYGITQGHVSNLKKGRAQKSRW